MAAIGWCILDDQQGLLYPLSEWLQPLRFYRIIHVFLHQASQSLLRAVGLLAVAVSDGNFVPACLDRMPPPFDADAQQIPHLDLIAPY